MLYLDRIVAACLRRKLFYYTPGGERGGIWIFYFSPYCFACHTTGLGRQEEFGTVHIPGGRQWRFGCWPAACCHHYSAFGQHAISWFALAALLAAIIMIRLGTWYRTKLSYVVTHQSAQPLINHDISRRTKYGALLILILLIFSKYFYTACITSYFTFFLIDKFGVSVQTSQLCLFVFLLAFAIGTVAGGMLGDKFGRKYVIWFSILGAAPFAIAMPFANLTWTIICTFLSGLIIASAFSSIVVYATDLMPDKVGLIAGIFFGLMFGLGGLGSAFFGWLADRTSIEYIFQVSAFLPLLGIIAGLLPNTQKENRRK